MPYILHTLFETKTLRFLFIAFTLKEYASRRDVPALIGMTMPVKSHASTRLSHGDGLGYRHCTSSCRTVPGLARHS